MDRLPMTDCISKMIFRDALSVEETSPCFLLFHYISSRKVSFQVYVSFDFQVCSLYSKQIVAAVLIAALAVPWMPEVFSFASGE